MKQSSRKRDVYLVWFGFLFGVLAVAFGVNIVFPDTWVCLVVPPMGLCILFGLVGCGVIKDE